MGSHHGMLGVEVNHRRVPDQQVRTDGDGCGLALFLSPRHSHWSFSGDPKFHKSLRLVPSIFIHLLLDEEGRHSGCSGIAKPRALVGDVVNQISLDTRPSLDWKVWDVGWSCCGARLHKQSCGEFQLNCGCCQYAQKINQTCKLSTFATGGLSQVCVLGAQAQSFFT